MNAHEHVTATYMVKWYCQKANRDPAEAAGMHLKFDGDVIHPTTTVGDMDVENGDQIDVV